MDFYFSPPPNITPTSSGRVHRLSEDHRRKKNNNNNNNNNNTHHLSEDNKSHNNNNNNPSGANDDVINNLDINSTDSDIDAKNATNNVINHATNHVTPDPKMNSNQDHVTSNHDQDSFVPTKVLRLNSTLPLSKQTSSTSSSSSSSSSSLSSLTSSSSSPTKNYISSPNFFVKMASNLTRLVRAADHSSRQNSASNFRVTSSSSASSSPSSSLVKALSISSTITRVPVFKDGKMTKNTGEGGGGAIPKGGQTINLDEYCMTTSYVAAGAITGAGVFLIFLFLFFLLLLLLTRRSHGFRAWLRHWIDVNTPSPFDVAHVGFGDDQLRNSRRRLQQQHQQQQLLHHEHRRQRHSNRHRHPYEDDEDDEMAALDHSSPWLRSVSSSSGNHHHYHHHPSHHLRDPSQDYRPPPYDEVNVVVVDAAESASAQHPRPLSRVVLDSESSASSQVLRPPQRLGRRRCGRENRLLSSPIDPNAASNAIVDTSIRVVGAEAVDDDVEDGGNDADNVVVSRDEVLETLRRHIDTSRLPLSSCVRITSSFRRGGGGGVGRGAGDGVTRRERAPEGGGRAGRASGDQMAERLRNQHRTSLLRRWTTTTTTTEEEEEEEVPALTTDSGSENPWRRQCTSIEGSGNGVSDGNGLTASTRRPLIPVASFSSSSLPTVPLAGEGGGGRGGGGELMRGGRGGESQFSVDSPSLPSLPPSYSEVLLLDSRLSAEDISGGRGGRAGGGRGEGGVRSLSPVLTYGSCATGGLGGSGIFSGSNVRNGSLSTTLNDANSCNNVNSCSRSNVNTCSNDNNAAMMILINSTFEPPPSYGRALGHRVVSTMVTTSAASSATSVVAAANATPSAVVAAAAPAIVAAYATPSVGDGILPTHPTLPPTSFAASATQSPLSPITFLHNSLTFPSPSSPHPTIQSTISSPQGSTTQQSGFFSSINDSNTSNTVAL